MSLMSASSASSCSPTCLPVLTSIASISRESRPLLTGPIRTDVAMFRPAEASFTEVILAISNRPAPESCAPLRPRRLSI
ncbi:hypothetical protein G6F56_014528 [Rhizopus delemar]|nr:hypothetical protein G6F56_014528 [Rhizopus delemar]